MLLFPADLFGVGGTAKYTGSDGADDSFGWSKLFVPGRNESSI